MTNIEQPLTELLMDVVWMLEGGELSMEESESDLSSTLEFAYDPSALRARSKATLEKPERAFIWNEELRERLNKVKGLIGFELLSTQGTVLVRVDLEETAHDLSLPEDMLESLSSHLHDEFEMTLFMPGVYHLVMFRELTGIMVHVFCDTATTNVAMARWHLQKALSVSFENST